MLPPTFSKLCFANCRNGDINILPVLIKRRNFLTFLYLNTQIPFHEVKFQSNMSKFQQKKVSKIFFEKLLYPPLLHSALVQLKFSFFFNDTLFGLIQHFFDSFAYTTRPVIRIGCTSHPPSKVAWKPGSFIVLRQPIFYSFS